MSCIYPFKGIFVESTMDVKFCCAGQFYLGNLREKTLEEILLGPLAQEIRDATKKGEVHDYCKPCYGIEKHGGNSQRTPIEIHRLDEIYNEISYHPEEIDIRWSNTCNLACNYCFPHFSSRWADVLKIKIQSPGDEIYEKIFDFIQKHKDSIKGVMLLGGEPLLLKQNLRLLDVLSAKNFHMITNLANPIDRNAISKKLLEEEKVIWGISFENVGDRFEYVRDGAKWNVFYNNLHILKKQSKKMHFYPLYSIYSAFNLIEYYEIVEQFNIQNLTWQLLLQHPFRVDTLSKKMVELAVQEINKVEERFGHCPGVQDLLNIKTNLMNEPLQPYAGNKFLSWTYNLENKQFQKARSFHDLWPVLAKDLEINA